MVSGCRGVQKTDLIHNGYLPTIEVDAQNYQVRAPTASCSGANRRTCCRWRSAISCSDSHATGPGATGDVDRSVPDSLACRRYGDNGALPVAAGSPSMSSRQSSRNASTPYLAKAFQATAIVVVSYSLLDLPAALPVRRDSHQQEGTMLRQAILAQLPADHEVGDQGRRPARLR